MIKTAEKKNKSLANLRFLVMDGGKLEFPDNNFDFILSTFTSHHWKNPLRVFNEIYRVLKPAGIAWIYDGYPSVKNEEINNLLKFPFDKLPKFFIKMMFSWHGFSKKEYRDYYDFLVGNGNFREVNLEPYGFMMKIELKKFTPLNSRLWRI